MKTILHKAATRGNANHGWLNSWHTFSFANYHNTERMHFGALRVLNDDTVSPAMGFGSHPHDNMEIVSIPLAGDLEHQDNTGTKAIIKRGDVQIMSAGTGIVHSEKNASNTEAVKFLQIWIFPNKKNIAPRYDQKSFTDEEKNNRLATVVSPLGTNDGGVQIQQEAWFHLGNLKEGTTIDYTVKKNGNGVYAFLLEGNVTINEIVLNRRDGLSITETDTIKITSDSNAEILLMEVPLTF